MVTAPLYEDDTDWRDADGEPAHVMPQYVPYVDLPIPMPKSIIVITDAADKPLAMTVAGRRIRREDISVVWEAVRQYNADIAAREGPTS